MGITSKTIKCSECGVFTTDSDYCKNCGALISYQKKEEIRAEVLKKELIDEERYKLDNPSWVERLKKHPFWLYRIVGFLLYSVIFIVSTIGSLLAWFIAMVAAG